METQIELPVKPACYYCNSYHIDMKNRCQFCDYGRIYTDKYVTREFIGETKDER